MMSGRAANGERVVGGGAGATCVHLHRNMRAHTHPIYTLMRYISGLETGDKNAHMSLYSANAVFGLTLCENNNNIT